MAGAGLKAPQLDAGLGVQREEAPLRVSAEYQVATPVESTEASNGYFEG